MAEPDVLGAITTLAADIGPALEPPGYGDLLRSITDTARRLTDAAACSIAVLDDAAEGLEFVAASGAGAEQIVGTRIEAGRGIAGWVLASGQSISIADVAQDPRFASDVAEASGYVPRSILAAPLPGSDGPIGVLEVLDARSQGEQDAHASLVSLLAQQAALAVESSAIFEDLGRTLLEALGRAADGEALSQALETTIREAPKPRRELAELTWIFYQLSRLGPDGRTAAVNVLGSFLTFASRTAPLP